MAKTKAGANAGLGQWCTKLSIRAGIQARSLGIVSLPAVPAFSTKLTICPPFGCYTGLASSNAQCSDCTSDGSTRRLWYKHVTSSNPVTITACWLGFFLWEEFDDCGKITCYSVGASTGWAHAYQEGADCILRTLHAATKSIWWIMFQAFANECAVLLMLMRIAFMVSLCI